MHTDASLSGWGCTLSSGEVASGKWSASESLLHINYLEMKAIYFGLLCFSHVIKNYSLRIFSDNSTSVSYINKMGGTHSHSLCALSLQIWKLAFDLNTDIHAVHIPGVDNTYADFHSRSESDFHDYGISQDSFNDLIEVLNFCPQVDLFASRLNHKLPCYVSRSFDPFSWKVDAFTFSWPHSVYMFPPINLLKQALIKFIHENIHLGILVTPAWPGMPEVPLIVQYLIADPVLIPEGCLEGKRPTRFPFNLAVWPISTIKIKTQDYLSQRERRCSKALPLPLWSPISTTGKNSMDGMRHMGIIFRSLYP